MMADTQCDSLADVIKCQGGRGDCKVHKKLRSFLFFPFFFLIMHKNFGKNVFEKFTWTRRSGMKNRVIGRRTLLVCSSISQRRPVFLHFNKRWCDFRTRVICSSRRWVHALISCQIILMVTPENVLQCSGFFFFFTFCATVLPSVRYWVIVSPRTQGGRGRENQN